MRKARDENIETPITSMIDIVFLLIIFFVVTSAIEKEAVDETIKLAKSYFVEPVTKVDPRTITINVKRVSDHETKYNIALVNLPLPNLVTILKAARAKYGTDVPIVIRADSLVKFSEIDKIMKYVGEAGLYRISLSSLDQGKR